MAMRPPTPPRMGFFPRNVGNPGLFGQGARGVSPFAGPPRVPASRGLLSQLFQRSGATQGAASMFSRAAGAGTETSLLQGLTNPQTITSFLGKTQNFLNTAQQIGPLIQQYGPLVRNLPAMWRIYQGLQSSPDNEEQDNEPKVEETSMKEETSSEEESKNNNSSPRVEKKKSTQSKQVRSSKKKKTGESVPKLYIN
ncbi:VrrA/YqfQ family protein [Bacillus niameyensis]|uniref:VrrA/YqfQ family protein n=1 Tax=Bacillus niameyensis TaxID=1522308 RepID=UPI00078323F6|nr:VrrA/YqfQ family protein [Bacillus niameyensis]